MHRDWVRADRFSAAAVTALRLLRPTLYAPNKKNESAAIYCELTRSISNCTAHGIELQAMTCSLVMRAVALKGNGFNRG